MRLTAHASPSATPSCHAYPRRAAPDPPGGGNESISYFDYPLRVLAECDTIGCARELTGRLWIVDRPLLKEVAQALLGLDFIPMHATFCDKSAACIGVEWGPGGVAAVSDLPHGVFTNVRAAPGGGCARGPIWRPAIPAPPLPRARAPPHDPSLPAAAQSPPLGAQEALLAQYDAASLATYTAALDPLNWPGGLGTTDTALANSSDSDSVTRCACSPRCAARALGW